jgi:ribosomal protein S18 acetylase RimI-like enzyme
VKVERVLGEQAEEIGKTLDAGLNPWLRYNAGKGSVSLFRAADGGLLAIVEGEARLGHPTTVEAASALGRATTGMALEQAWGDAEAVRALLAAREDADRWELINSSSELALQAESVRRPVQGEIRCVAELRKRAEGEELPAPFDQWMEAFITEAINPGMSVPHVTVKDLYAWMVDGVPRAMAGILERGDDSVRIITVYTPRNARGKGYASALVSALAARAIGRGRRIITLDVATQNIAARRAYERAGFRFVLATERWKRHPSPAT